MPPGQAFPLSNNELSSEWTKKPLPGKAFTMTAISDGFHDILVVDAVADADGVVHFELAITSGPHKGDVVRVRASGLTRDPIDMLGLPARLVVEDGAPRVEFD